MVQQAIDDRIDEAAWQQVLAAEEQHAKAVLLLGRVGTSDLWDGHDRKYERLILTIGVRERCRQAKKQH